MEGLGLEETGRAPAPTPGPDLRKSNSHNQVHSFGVCWAGASRLSRRFAGGTHLSSDSCPALILRVGKLQREKRLVSPVPSLECS